jgi:glycosyltransferase involved in cell wall biosynthesis
LRLAVVSPFLDRQHGTERCIVEQLERLARRNDVEIHVYAQRVEDLRGVTRDRKADSPGGILWHKVPAIKGPHLFAYLWWFLANHLQRFWDSRIRGLKFDVLYSPGINAFDANAIAVHIVFHAFYDRVREQLKFRKAAIATWPRLLHRLLYYRLIMALERMIYRRRAVSLNSVSSLVALQLNEYLQRADVTVIPNGVDNVQFSSQSRTELRASARARFRLSPSDFVLLLIGNDWKKKGLDCLLETMASCAELGLKLLVVGSDERSEYERAAARFGFAERVFFLEPSSDVIQFYAAADAYVGPSLEDAYGLPVLEAMACGLPVIASSRAGVSEIIAHRKNGMILHNPQDSVELAKLLRELSSNPGMCQRIGQEAALTAGQQTWDRNVASLWDFLNQAAIKKSHAGAQATNG